MVERLGVLWRVFLKYASALEELGKRCAGWLMLAQEVPSHVGRKGLVLPFHVVDGIEREVEGVVLFCSVYRPALKDEGLSATLYGEPFFCSLGFCEEVLAAVGFTLDIGKVAEIVGAAHCDDVVLRAVRAIATVRGFEVAIEQEIFGDLLGDGLAALAERLEIEFHDDAFFLSVVSLTAIIVMDSGP